MAQNSRNTKNVDYISEPEKYSTPKTAIQRKVRITGLLILFTFLFIFTIAFMFIASNLII